MTSTLKGYVSLVGSRGLHRNEVDKRGWRSNQSSRESRGHRSCPDPVCALGAGGEWWVPTGGGSGEMVRNYKLKAVRQIGNGQHSGYNKQYYFCPGKLLREQILNVLSEYTRR